MDFYEFEETKEVVLLVGVQRAEDEDTEQLLDELGELAQTAGAEVAGRVIQRRENIHPGTYIGKGKIDEVRMLLHQTQATGIICDDELSPAQLNNLQDELDCKVMDRTLLILDIFARHAVTREGKIQVELAQLKYRAARLTGLGNSLSRLGGGIGTRGPGEKKLEMDRRLIRERIGHLKRELEDVVRHRELIRSQRTKSGQKVAALVGYTSVGKSAIFRRLTGADVLEDAKLFATLDTTTRGITLTGKQEVLLTDTVGFIRKLPHHLVESFKSTLEEARYADILLHVVDVSSPQMEAQMYTVYETLKELGIGDKPVITIFNKIDLLEEYHAFRDFQADASVMVSARTGEGLDRIKDEIEEILRRHKIYVERLYPYDQAGLVQLIRRKGELLSEEYLAEGIAVKAYVPHELYGKI
jgi:GTP-binding protein HflX